MAIDLTTLALYFFIQLNPDRGKTKEKHKEEEFIWKGRGNSWYLNNGNN